MLKYIVILFTVSFSVFIQAESIVGCFSKSEVIDKNCKIRDKMNKYDEQYYIVTLAYNKETLCLKPLKKTFNRKFSYKKMMLGQEPLFFENAYKEDDKKDGVVHTIKNLHMNANFIMVDNKIKNKLEDFEINNFQLYPTVIIADNDKFHEDFWFFNIYNRFSALDLDKSEISNFDPDDRKHDVIKGSLSDEILDAIPEENRLIFRDYKWRGGYTIVHQRIVDIFNEQGVTTAKFTKLSEFRFGDQFGANE